MAIANVGKVFKSVDDFENYLEGLVFGPWKPRFLVVHHTGAPNLKMWRGWQVRSNPVTDEQWLRNLAGYYGGLGWSAGPHFFFTPNSYCVLSPPTRRGVHAVKFNAVSWGLEMVGEFDSEAWEDPIRARYVEGIAAICLAAGFQLEPFERGVRGLHFHRDDPTTSKTCPGLRIKKPELIPLIKAAMDRRTMGDHDDERVDESVQPKVDVPVPATPKGKTKVAELNLREAASGKAPIVMALPLGQGLSILGKAMNGQTEWLRVWLVLPSGKEHIGWVAGRFVERLPAK